MQRMSNINMNGQNTNYTKTISFIANAEKVFNALTKDLHLWWGKTSNVDLKTEGQFTIEFENGYWWSFKITEYIPNKKLIWKCIDGEPDFNKEWIGHILHWVIKKKYSKTTVSFQQTGLTPKLHCYEVCSSTWDMFIGERLKQFVDIKKTTV